MPSDHERRAREFWRRAPIDCSGWYDRELHLAVFFAAVADEARAEALEEAIAVADLVGLEKPTNRFNENPRAAFRSGACRVAWELRALQRNNDH